MSWRRVNDPPLAWAAPYELLSNSMLFDLIDVLLALSLAIVIAIATLWMAGAIYYDVAGGRAGRWLAPLWILGVVAFFVVWPTPWQSILAFATVFSAFLVWWLRLQPSHDRDWDPSVARLPRVDRDGDSIVLHDVRNFDFRSRDDYLVRYETRTVHLSNLKGLDILFCNWGSPWMSHPALVFDFGPDGRICVSIEVRFRKGQSFSIVRSFFRQQELIFIVADERDIVLRRTKSGLGEEVLLYRFNVDAAELCDVFLDYVAAVNSLYDKPRWYHAFCANCTTSFYRLAGTRCRWDWRVLANGRLDRALYEDGRLDRTLPFEELRRLACITEIANASPEQGWSDSVRRELERRRHER